MTFEYLDLLLKYLNENKGYTFLTDIHKGFNKEINISKYDVLILLNKLVKDEYVTKKPIFIRDWKEGEVVREYSQPSFFISFEGIVLLESLPKKYENKPYVYFRYVENRKKRLDRIESIPKRYWWLLAIITFVMGLFADIGKEVLRQKILPESIQLPPNIQEMSDTSLKK